MLEKSITIPIEMVRKENTRGTLATYFYLLDRLPSTHCYQCDKKYCIIWTSKCITGTQKVVCALPYQYMWQSTGAGSRDS